MDTFLVVPVSLTSQTCSLQKFFPSIEVAEHVEQVGLDDPYCKCAVLLFVCCTQECLHTGVPVR